MFIGRSDGSSPNSHAERRTWRPAFSKVCSGSMCCSFSNKNIKKFFRNFDRACYAKGFGVDQPRWRPIDRIRGSLCVIWCWLKEIMFTNSAKAEPCRRAVYAARLSPAVIAIHVDLEVHWKSDFKRRAPDISVATSRGELHPLASWFNAGSGVAYLFRSGHESSSVSSATTEWTMPLGILHTPVTFAPSFALLRGGLRRTFLLWGAFQRGISDRHLTSRPRT